MSLLRAVRRAALACCPKCAIAPAISARPSRNCSARDPDPRHRRRSAGGDRRAGLLRARHDEVDLRHRLLRAAQHRRDAGRLEATGCSRRSPISSAASAPMRSKARSSLPAPPCNGCATGWGSSRSAEAERSLAEAADPAQDVYLVPAFVGLGAPYWDPKCARRAVRADARHRPEGTRARRARKRLLPDRDLLDAMRADWPQARSTPTRCCASMAAWWPPTGPCSGSPTFSTRRSIGPMMLETTALGAAYLAGLAAGF